MKRQFRSNTWLPPLSCFHPACKGAVRTYFAHLNGGVVQAIGSKLGMKINPQPPMKPNPRFRQE